MAVTYLGLGSNLDDPRTNLGRALSHLRVLGEVDGVSRVYRSEPVGLRDQPEFLNVVVRLRTELAPDALLDAVKDIERSMGRAPSVRFGPRRIDIDLLFYDDLVLESSRLTVPHPRMMDRAFVLRPLAELDPSLRDPRSGVFVADRLAEGSFERAEPDADDPWLEPGPSDV
jgi:2-amino-4-hydroxy-6-hydroxymethyldihydropteridine diphosphokinase